MKKELLNRDNFREGVFKRDNYQCVICKEKAADAHHILERRLWTAPEELGGYFLDNGASLCPKHHIEAEQTVLSCNDIREKAKINSVIIPDHYYKDLEYDKWGNVIMPNGNRLKGELFYDESVQKIIQPVLNSFSKYIKYPRTYHLPWSKLGKDDRQLEDDSIFINKRVVVTEKRDGENTSVYSDYFHARSIDGTTHPSRDWVKGFMFQNICWQLPDNIRLCGENLYAKHSIEYSNLDSYFELFSIWEDMTCLSWEDTIAYANMLKLKMVPVIYQGIYDKSLIIKEYTTKFKGAQTEGYVIRLEDSFDYKDFRKSVGKYVESEFKQKVNSSHGHWISQKITPNKLKEKNEI